MDNAYCGTLENGQNKINAQRSTQQGNNDESLHQFLPDAMGRESLYQIQTCPPTEHHQYRG